MKNNLIIYAKVASHALALIVLALGLYDDRVGDYFWYGVVGGVDPFGGPPPLRIILDNMGAGLFSGLACGIYVGLIQPRHKYALYSIAFAGLSAVKVAYFSQIWGHLPFTVEFLASEFGVMLLAGAAGIVGGECLTYLGKKWGGFT